MTAYRSPDNPDILVVPPRKKSQREINEALQRELELSNLHGELMTLYQEIPMIMIRLKEAERIQALLAKEADELRDELEKAEVRKNELEELFKG